MLENLTLFRSASAMARHATLRHSVIAENIAHADTPGYRARDIAPFSLSLDSPERPRATRMGHMTGGLADGRAAAREIDAPVSPNGNSVSLEDQAVRGAEAQAQFSLAMTIYQKGLDLMRIGLGPNR